MSIINITMNGTNTYTNTATGANLVVTKGVSDLQVITQLCQDYHFYFIMLSAVTIGMILLKGTMHRMMVKDPKNQGLRKIYKSSDNLLDMVLLMISILHLVISSMSYFT